MSTLGYRATINFERRSSKFRSARVYGGAFSVLLFITATWVIASTIIYWDLFFGGVISNVSRRKCAPINTCCTASHAEYRIQHSKRPLGLPIYVRAFVERALLWRSDRSAQKHRCGPCSRRSSSSILLCQCLSPVYYYNFAPPIRRLAV